MKLLLMRHVEAASREAAAVEFDAERPLTKHGLAQARQVADAIQADSKTPVKVLTSPLLRAQQTAEAVAEACSVADPIQCLTLLAPGVGADDVLAIAANEGAADAWTLLVMHNPDISAIVSELINDDVRAAPGCLYALDTTVDDGTCLAQLLFSFAPD
jgi:phosphohistidine phosphatase